MERWLVAAGMVVVGALIILNSAEAPTTDDSPRKFASYEEIRSFLANNTQSYRYGTGVQMLGVPTSMRAMQKTELDSSSDYSTTNIQVAGVDEADIIKTDENYIYAVSGNKLVIVSANPAESMAILSEIEINGTQDIFVNGNKLIVFGNDYSYYGYPEPMPLGSEAVEGLSVINTVTTDNPNESTTSGPLKPVAEKKVAESIMFPRYPYYNKQEAFIKVFDITERSNPTLESNLSTDGYYQDSRMIGKYVYAIVNQPIYSYDDVPIPIVRPMKKAFPDVYYFDAPGESYNFVNIIALDVNSGAYQSKAFLMPSSQSIFVSESNVYLAYTIWKSELDFFDKLIDKVLVPSFPDLSAKISEVRARNITNSDKMQELDRILDDYRESIGPERAADIEKQTQKLYEQFQKDISKEMEKTVIHKISLAGLDISYQSKGTVPGHILNQFSMDENNRYFRIATTSGGWDTQVNNLYVLDSGMNIVGKVEDLAKGERIYSVRFMGNRAYMVTFRQVDPLFVIDISNPTEPRVLGYLKVTGFSDYLHPVDSNHIIGVGKEATEEGLFQGLKMSLFDVSDVSNPKEISKIVIGDRGTDSEVLRDHKAFLFNKEKNLLVIPVLLAEIDRTKPIESWTYGDYKWQGAYVFDFSIENGFRLRGKVDHTTNETEEYQLYYGQYSVRRSLYIGNVLYTMSDRLIKANSLADLAEISKVDLPGYNYGRIIIY